MTDEQIKHMVQRFLMWRLPEDFRPDGGISATRPTYGPEVAWEPSGTNLLDARQAEAMVRHMLEGMTIPANLNAPDKQEALAVEGVYLRARELEPTDFEVAKATKAILAADKDDLLAGDGYPEGAAEAFARAALMAVAPALAGDDRNGVERLVRAVEGLRLHHGIGSACFCINSDLPDHSPQCKAVTAALAALSRTPSSPQADEADVER